MTLRLTLAGVFLLTAVLMTPAPTCFGDLARADQETRPADRQALIAGRLCEIFDTPPPPFPGGTLASCLPPEAYPLSIRNPGFGFTYANGLRPKGVWIIGGVAAGQPARMRGQTKGFTDPIIGWNERGCAGMHTSYPPNFLTPPDGSTAYMLSQGRPNTLNQVIEGGLKPGHRYVLLVEVYARKDFDPVAADDIILDLLDGSGNALPEVGVHRKIPELNPATNFAIATVSLTTGPNQTPGDLTVVLGTKCATKKVRTHYDNIRLWAQPLR